MENIDIAQSESNVRQEIGPKSTVEGFETEGDLDGFVTADEGFGNLNYAASHPGSIGDTDSTTDYDDFESPDSTKGHTKFFVTSDRDALSDTVQDSVPDIKPQNLMNVKSFSNSDFSAAGENNLATETLAKATNFHVLSTPRPLKSLPKIVEGTSSSDEKSPNTTSNISDADKPAAQTNPGVSQSSKGLSATSVATHVAVTRQRSSLQHWHQYDDGFGNKYWYNDQTGISSWFDPTEKLKAGKLSLVREQTNFKDTNDNDNALEQSSVDGKKTDLRIGSNEKHGAAKSTKAMILKPKLSIVQNEAAVTNMIAHLETQHSDIQATLPSLQSSHSNKVADITKPMPVHEDGNKIHQREPQQNTQLFYDKNKDIWEKHTDPESKCKFYFHRKSGRSQWTQPPGIKPISAHVNVALLKTSSDLQDIQSLKHSDSKSNGSNNLVATTATTVVQQSHTFDSPALAEEIKSKTGEENGSSTSNESNDEVTQVPNAACTAVFDGLDNLQRQFSLHKEQIINCVRLLQSQSSKVQSEVQEKKIQELERKLRDTVKHCNAERMAMQQKHELELNEMKRKYEADAEIKVKNAVAAIKLEIQIADKKISRQLELEQRENSRLRQEIRQVVDESVCSLHMLFVILTKHNDCFFICTLKKKL